MHDGQWMVKRVISIEDKTYINRGKVMQRAFVEWEDVWFQYSSLEEETKEWVEDDTPLTVIGPLGSLDEEKNRGLNPMKSAWMVEVDGDYYHMPYEELRDGRYYKELLEYYEKNAEIKQEDNYEVVKDFSLLTIKQ